MRVFLYKRTHVGDPDEGGRFGIDDCMGRLRDCSFDAVIGIGGICSQAIADGIGGKVKWIGIGPRRVAPKGRKGSVILFNHFALYESAGREFDGIAPALALRLYTPKSPRFLFSDDFNKTEKAEVERLLKLAKNARPSSKTTYPVWEDQDPLKCTCQKRNASQSRLCVR
jgi:hypothetical protein